MERSLKKIVERLRRRYGSPCAPITSDPFELILLENVAYLVDDQRRHEAFEHLRKTVGLRPSDILKASLPELDAATKLGGGSPQYRSVRIKECALIAMNEFSGDLSAVCRLPTAKAIRALKQFPGIGEPGAEKVLLFTHSQPLLALDSNGLRVLLRIGFGGEKKNYSGSYRSVRDEVASQIGDDCQWLIDSHQLLRQHGKTLCKTNKPRCGECPIKSSCDFFLSQA